MTSKLVSEGSDKKSTMISDGLSKMRRKAKPTLAGSDTELTTSDEWNMSSISGGDFIDFECRKSVVEDIMKGLKNEEINMIGVYGIAGMGKTTLVTEVCKQAKMGGLFEEVVMVSLSQYSNERGIQQQIGNALGLELEALDTIHEREDVLSKTIKNKSQILIIIDNVWERVKPSKIGIPHGKEHEGCKILFTTRSQMVCHDMPRKSKTIHLNALMDKDAWHLFSRHAGVVVDSLSSHHVAREVVRECDGIPLALVILGKALSDKDQSKWEAAAQELKAFEPAKAIGGINVKLFSCLKLSYDYLESEQIKQFFLLCCLFPLEFDIPKLTLIKYGVGEGLFESKPIGEGLFESKPSWDKVTVADGMIETLKASCLLLDGHISTHVRMHQAVRDCALVLLASRCSQHNSHDHLRHLVPMVRAGEGLNRWPKRGMSSENYTTVSLMHNDIRRLPIELKFPQLRILLLQHNHNLKEIPDDFFKELTSLRVLDLSGCFPPIDASDQHLHSVPRSLLQPLKELRTLCLDQYLRGPLPELGYLKNLKILSLSGSEFITELPRRIGQLTNLILLDLSFCPRMETIHPKTLESLIWLENLDMRCSFRGWWNASQGAAGISFQEVTYLSSLKVLKVELPDTQHIPKEVSPDPEWSDFCIFIGREHVRDLKLPEDLSSKALILNVPINNTFPAWFNKVVVKRLETLIYFECKGLKNLDVEIERRKGRSLVMKDLRYLCIRDCPHMEYIINTANWPSETGIIPFDSLKELHLQTLHSLGNICIGQLQNGLFNNLGVLEVEDCQSLTDVLLPSDVWKGSDKSLILCNLKTLVVRRCHNLRCILPLSVVRGLLQLEYLIVEDCEELEEIVEEDKVEEHMYFEIFSPLAGEKSKVDMFVPSNMIFLPHLKNLVLKILHNLTNVIPKGFDFQVPSFNTFYVESCPYVANFKINNGNEDEDHKEDDPKSISEHSNSKDDEEEKTQHNKEDKPTSNSQNSNSKDNKEKSQNNKGDNPASKSQRKDNKEKGQNNKGDNPASNSQRSDSKGEEEKGQDSGGSQYSILEEDEEQTGQLKEDNPTSNSQNSNSEGTIAKLHSPSPRQEMEPVPFPPSMEETSEADSSEEVEEEPVSYSSDLNQTTLPEDCIRWSSVLKNTPLLKNILNHVSYRARRGQAPVPLKLPGGWKQAYEWGQRLMAIPAAAILIEKAGFNYFLSIKPRNADRPHLSALMERWWGDTNTFHFPYFEMGITPSEFCFYTGLRVGGKPMPWNKHFGIHDLAEVISLLNRKPEAVTSNMIVQCSWLLNNFGNINLEVAPRLVESTVRAFLLYLLGQTLFSNGSGSVNLSLLIPLRNLEIAGKYDWGGAAMAYLFQQLRFFTRGVHGSLKGFWQVLEGWSHDYLGICPPVNFHQDDIFPRLRRWEAKQNTRGGSHSFGFVRFQLEQLTADKVHWSPFRKSIFYANNDMIHHARSLDTKRVLLVGPWCRSSYLGDRCWMQIHGGRRSFVPLPPPFFMGHEHELHESVVTQLVEIEGVDASGFIDPNADFASYWAENSVGFLLPQEYQSVDPTTHGGVTFKPEARREVRAPVSIPLVSRNYEPGPSSIVPSYPQEAPLYLEEPRPMIEGMRVQSNEYPYEMQNLRQQLLDRARQTDPLDKGATWRPPKTLSNWCGQRRG